jgi:hypothetical protein
MSKHEGSGLSLEGLAHRLEALERDNAELRDEVSALRGSGTRRGEVPALRGSDRKGDKEVASEFAGQVSRRSLLSKAGAAAVAAVAAGMLLNQREAKAEDTPEVTFFKAIQCMTSTTGAAVSAHHRGEATPGKNAMGVFATGPECGVKGVGFGSPGVWGQTDSHLQGGVYGQHTGLHGYGVIADGKGEGAGVLGRIDGTSGAGVLGEGKRFGVEGRITGDTGGDLAYGVFGLGGTHGVVGAITNGNGTGVMGDTGPRDGYGGEFRGGKAPLRLWPSTRTGRPTSGTHQQGEIYMDSAGALFVCTVDGSPGTWRKVTTTLAP